MEPHETAAMWLEEGMRWSSLRMQNDREAAIELFTARMVGACMAEEIDTAAADLAGELADPELVRDLGEEVDFQAAVICTLTVLDWRAPEQAQLIRDRVPIELPIDEAAARRDVLEAWAEASPQGEMLARWAQFRSLPRAFVLPLGHRIQDAFEAHPELFEVALLDLATRDKSLIDLVRSSLESGAQAQFALREHSELTTKRGRDAPTPDVPEDEDPDAVFTRRAQQEAVIGRPRATRSADSARRTSHAWPLWPAGDRGRRLRRAPRLDRPAGLPGGPADRDAALARPSAAGSTAAPVRTSSPWPASRAFVPSRRCS